ncbi:hypothetical protein M153_1359000771, partial [Pseudoloma neurophilia]
MLHNLPDPRLLKYLSNLQKSPNVDDLTETLKIVKENGWTEITRKIIITAIEKILISRQDDDVNLKLAIVVSHFIHLLILENYNLPLYTIFINFLNFILNSYDTEIFQKKITTKEEDKRLQKLKTLTAINYHDLSSHMKSLSFVTLLAYQYHTLKVCKETKNLKDDFLNEWLRRQSMNSSNINDQFENLRLKDSDINELRIDIHIEAFTNDFTRSTMVYMKFLHEKLKIFPYFAFRWSFEDIVLDIIKKYSDPNSQVISQNLLKDQIKVFLKHSTRFPMELVPFVIKNGLVNEISNLTQDLVDVIISKFKERQFEANFFIMSALKLGYTVDLPLIQLVKMLRYENLIFETLIHLIKEKDSTKNFNVYKFKISEDEKIYVIKSKDHQQNLLEFKASEVVSLFCDGQPFEKFVYICHNFGIIINCSSENHQFIIKNDVFLSSLIFQSKYPGVFHKNIYETIFEKYGQPLSVLRQWPSLINRKRMAIDVFNDIVIDEKSDDSKFIEIKKFFKECKNILKPKRIYKISRSLNSCKIIDCLSNKYPYKLELCLLYIRDKKYFSGSNYFLIEKFVTLIKSNQKKNFTLIRLLYENTQLFDYLNIDQIVTVLKCIKLQIKIKYSDSRIKICEKHSGSKTKYFYLEPTAYNLLVSIYKRVKKLLKPEEYNRNSLYILLRDILWHSLYNLEYKTVTFKLENSEILCKLLIKKKSTVYCCND